MASPPQHPPATTASAATSPPPTTAAASHPLPRAFLASSSPRRAAAPTPSPPPPPLFTGRPLNPNPNHSANPHGILYPVVSSSSAAAHHRRPPPVAVGFPRAHAVAVPIAPPPPPPPQQPPLVPTQPRSFAAAPRSAAAAGAPSRSEPPPRGVPIASQPKVNSGQSVALSHEHSNSRERERSRENTTTVGINDRKVRLLDSKSGSLYALCRSWVRNGVPHESQPSFGNGEPLLPRPLPASVVDSRIAEKDGNDSENEDSEQQKEHNCNYTAAKLLEEHVKRAKKIRAKLQKERLRRIERYKQRLALLLPPPSELGRHDGVA